MGLHSGAANFFNVSFPVRMLNRKRSIKFLTVCSKFFQGNFVPNAAVYSVRAVVNSGCRYDDVNFAVGGEDWDFWMCLAEVSFRSKLFLLIVETDKLCSSQLAWSLGRNSTGTTLLVPRKPCFFPSCSLGKHVCRWILNSQGSSSRETRFSRQSWQIPRYLGSYFATTRTYQLGFSL